MCHRLVCGDALVVVFASVCCDQVSAVMHIKCCVFNDDLYQIIILCALGSWLHLKVDI